MAPKAPKAPKPVVSAVSPKVYIASAPSISDVAWYYFFLEDIPIHVIEEIRSVLPPNTLRLLLP